MQGFQKVLVQEQYTKDLRLTCVMSSCQSATYGVWSVPSGVIDLNIGDLQITATRYAKAMDRVVLDIKISDYGIRCHFVQNNEVVRPANVSMAEYEKRRVHTLARHHWNLVRPNMPDHFHRELSQAHPKS